MTKATRAKRFWILLTIVTLSSATMLWLLWRYPVGTGIATLAVLTAFTVLVRLARAMDPEGIAGTGPR